MTFFTTPELLEIGDIPFPSPNQKPTRDEALEYYRKVADHYQLDVRQYETVLRVEGSDGGFRVRVQDRFEREQTLQRAQDRGRHWLLRPAELPRRFPAKRCRR